MSQYLSEAFKRLDALNEDTFAINDNGLEDLVKFRDDDELDNSIDVIDPEATNDEELQDSYVGKVILDCCVCHSKIYKDVEDVVIDGELANTDEECPFCYTTDGYKVIGQVASFDGDAANEEEPEDGEAEDTSDSDNESGMNEGLFGKKNKQLFDVWCQDGDEKWTSLEGVSEKEADREVKDAYENNEGAENFKAWKEPGKVKNEGLFGKKDTQLYDVWLERPGQQPKLQGKKLSKKEADDAVKTLEYNTNGKAKVYAKPHSDDDVNGYYDRVRKSTEDTNEGLSVRESKSNIPAEVKPYYNKLKGMANDTDILVYLALLHDSYDDFGWDEDDDSYDWNSPEGIEAIIEDMEVDISELSEEEYEEYSNYWNGVNESKSIRNRGPLEEAKTFQNQDLWCTRNGKEEIMARNIPEKDAKRMLKDFQKDADEGEKYSLKPAVDKDGNEAPIKTRKEVRQDKKAAQDAYDERRGYKDTLANKLRMGGLPSQRYAVVHDDGYEDTHLTKKQARGAVAAAKRDGKEAQMYRQKFDKDGNVKQDDKYKREDLEEGIFGPKKDSTEYRNKITNFRNEAAKITGVDSLTSLATEVANLTNEAVEFLRQSHTDEWGEVRGSHYERAEKILKQYDLTIKAVQKAKSFSDVSYEVDALIDEILSGVKDRFAIIRKLNKYRIGLLDSIDSDKAVKKDMLEEFRYQVYIKLSNIKGKLQKRSYVRLFESRLKENVNNLSLDTDDTHLEVSTDESGKLTVSTSPIGATDTEVEGDSDGEVITPLEPETQNEISDNVGDGEEIEIDMDEFDEESFDELGESYLKKVYENVNSFKTSRVSFIKNKLIVEGVIKFNSGKSKKTNFIFESREATKSGKVRFIGENKEIARGKKSFTVTGRVTGNKFLSESFNYNYGVRGADGKVQRLYGTVRRSK